MQFKSDNSGYETLAEYKYDAWGKIVSITDGAGNDVSNDASHIANINPFRYRSYYYDKETKFYYLNSRYYDPEIGRFISMDDTGVITANPTGMTDKNLYSYCDNNPISRYDLSGNFWAEIGEFITTAVKVVASVVTQAKAVVNIPSTVAKIAVASTVAVASGKATFDDVVNDVKNFSFFNNDETKVLESKVFSSYKGTPVLRHEISGITSFSISNTIVLNRAESINGRGINTVKHEWGHTVQQSLIGTPKYLARIALPSIIGCIANPPSKTYYSLPWERSADFFGGVVSTDYYEGSGIVAGWYFMLP